MIEIPTITKNTVPERTATVRRIDATGPPRGRNLIINRALESGGEGRRRRSGPIPLSNEGLGGRRTEEMLLMGGVDCAANERQRHWAPPCRRCGSFHCGRR